MKDRIRTVRQKKGLSQGEFAERLNLSRNFISLVENGSRDASDRTVADICRLFDVNATWLRTGEGEMFVKKDAERELAEFLADVASDRENSARRQLIRIMARLPEEMWETIEQILKDMAEEQLESCNVQKDEKQWN